MRYQMPDRELAPGDPVLYFFSHGDEATPATVLRALPGNRYVIQLDPPVPLPATNDPHIAALHARFKANQLAAEKRLDAQLRANGQCRQDVQDAFEADVANLLFFAKWE
jgi:hypothetical protein